VLRPFGLAPQSWLWVLNMNGARSVVFFYIISGFLISYVLEYKYAADGSGTIAFFRSRALRIYPLWWPVLALAAAAGTPSWLSQHSPIAILPPAVLLGVDWIVCWKFPHSDALPSLVQIGWTLGAELTFYAMAPWVLRSMRLALILFALSVAVRLATVSLTEPGANYVLWTYFFFPSTLMFFLMGHMAQRFVKLGTASSVALIGAALVASCLERSVSIDGPWSLAASLFFAAALPGIFAATKDSRLSNAVGDLTYPLYLVHMIAMRVVFGTSIGAVLIGLKFEPRFHAVMLLAIFMAAALIAAALAHVFVEKPTRRLLGSISNVRAWRSGSGGTRRGVAG
jgi:peptidoglycan/LPS O-acetylase OafA/YrhL